ncbi:MAG: carboxypeptidase regulatory-like domain-containing protein [Clostridia bacterium]|nr:carboxypeptidase regulatory-like domain-containing protein [Clostridia bacterium]
MGKKLGISIKKLLAALSLVLVVFFCVPGCSLFNKTASAFSVSGYVFDENAEPVEGVLINCELGEYLTDANGKYVIPGITDSIIVRPSIEGYCFETISKKITSANDDANFIASKKYTLTGGVSNNGTPVPNARVVVNSLAGENWSVNADSFGQFIVPGVAGTATINCFADEVFYPASATINSSSVSIETTSSIEINVEFDAGRPTSRNATIRVGDSYYSIASGRFYSDNITCGTEIELISNAYAFSKQLFVVNSLNQVEYITAKKLYAISGIVKSGNRRLLGAEVYVNGKLSAYTDGTGHYTIRSLTETNTISVVYPGLEFEDQVVTNETTEKVNFDGTKSISLVLNCDENDAASVYANEIELELNAENILEGVKFGDIISVESDGYLITPNTIVVDERDEHLISAYALYTPEVILNANFDYTLLLDGNEVELSNLTNLHGKHVISAKYLNYHFTESLVNFNNQTASIFYQIPYNVKLQVVSGNLILENATVSIGGEIYTANNGEIEFLEIVGENEICVSCDGYKSSKLIVNSETDLVIDLSYTVSGTVKTGDVATAMATVMVGSAQTTTDSNGHFEVSNVYGLVDVTVTKESYVFESQNATCGCELEFDGTFKIYGKVSNGDEVFANRDIVLRDIDTFEDAVYKTNSNGEFEILGLNKKYWLLSLNENGVPDLKPDYYLIAAGGEYNFNLSGYKISGNVKNGSLSVEGARVTAGSTSTYTDADGNYTFELLTGECTISVEKTGFAFSSPVNVDDSRDGEEINFTATYSISGKIMFGENGLEGVSVKLNGTLVTTTNSNGEFIVSGLEDELLVSFEKTGYNIGSSIIVNKNVNLELTALAVKTITVVSGNLEITEFRYFVNGTDKGISNLSTVSVEVVAGDLITFEKDGYVISSVLIGDSSSYVANCTYSISGSVMSGAETISNAIVSYMGKTIQTSKAGTFVLSGLEGEVEVSVSKTGFESVNKVAKAGEVLSFNLTYSIYGSVMVGSKPLDNVNVYLNGELTVQTDELGKFELSGISGKFNLTFEKQGYGFDAIKDKFGSQRVLVSAKYELSGIVMSGDIPVSNANVELILEDGTASTYVKTNASGEFKFTDVSETVSLRISKDGYKTVLINGFSDTTSEIFANLSYSVKLNFGSTGVKIYLNNIEKTTTGVESITFDNLTGTNLFRFEKNNTTFTPNNVSVDGPRTITVSLSVAYNIYGYVKTTTGIAISGAKVKVGSKVTSTNSSGYYELSGVAGSVQLENSNLSSSSLSISADGDYSFTNIAVNDFAYYLYENAYAKLNGASSVQILADGTVVGDAGIMKTTQYVHSVFKRDNNGNIVKQNLNSGEVVNAVVMKVDPNISLFVYYNASTGATKYQVVKGINNVTSKTSAKHTVSGLSDTTPQNIKNTYGALPTEYSPYSVSKSSLKSISGFKQNADGGFTFTLSLSTTQNGYKSQIVAMAPSGTTFKSFSSLNHTYTIDRNGWITKIVTSEAYTINQTVDCSVTSNITYNYYTNASNLAIDNISIASDSALNNSLLKSNQTVIPESYSIKNDLVTSLIYGN